MRRRTAVSCAILLALFQNGCSFSSSLIAPRSPFVARRQQRGAPCSRPSPPRSSSPSALAVIEADEVDFDFDVGLGGVRLAQEAAVLVSGTVQHAPGTADAEMAELRRYREIHPVSEATMASALRNANAKVVCSGRGKELYKDPGSTTTKEVTYAPKDAARDALAGAGTAMDCDRVRINFLGGQDLQYLEVMEAVQQLVLNLDVKTKCKISFSSISDGRFPKGAAAVTVVGWTGEEAAAVTEGSSALAEISEVERAVALGRLFFRDDGDYYTVLESDLNPAVA